MDIHDQVCRTWSPTEKFSNKTGIEDKERIPAHERIQPKDAESDKRRSQRAIPSTTTKD